MANNGHTHPNGNGHHDDLYTIAEQITTQEFEALDAQTLARLSEPDEAELARKTIIEDAVRLILTNVGEDPERDGLQRTPQRVAKMYDELLAGYGQDVKTIINNAMFEVEYGEGEMVVVAHIDYTSMCEHHMLPFTGQAHIAYIPRNKVVGLSKIPRIVDMFARRLQVQERLTSQIADALEEHLDPLGVMVVVEGQHSCAALRGVKKHGVNMVTTAKRGAFRTDAALRDEFYRLARI
ncbi:MAG: GTP cyclohydrolase I FolE [Chloroflexi bacterium]|nr:GTP cyclohydrolase I FolE [Chloroflexota bacterium]